MYNLPLIGSLAIHGVTSLHELFVTVEFHCRDTCTVSINIYSFTRCLKTVGVNFSSFYIHVVIPNSLLNKTKPTICVYTSFTIVKFYGNSCYLSNSPAVKLTSVVTQVIVYCLACFKLTFVMQTYYKPYYLKLL